jgi:predicted dehydrogenase
VGYNRRYYSSVQDARKILQQSEGGVFDVFIPELSLVSHSKKQDFELSVLENGIHMVDLTRYLFGEIVEADIAFSSVTDGLQAVCLSVVTENGLKGTIRCFGGVPENYSINYWNANMSIELKPIELLKLNYDLKLEEANLIIPFKRYNKNVHEWNLGRVDIECKPGFVMQYQEFKNFILGRPEGNPLPNLSDAYKSLFWAKKIVFQAN